MQKSWLTNKVTFEIAEQFFRDLKKQYKLNVKCPPEEFIKFKEKFLDGDELYEFNSGENSFINLSGRSGYSIVRDGEIIDSYLTWVS